MRARQLQQPSARFGNTSGLHVSQRTWPQYSQTFALNFLCWQTEQFSPLFIAVSLFKEDGQFTDRREKLLSTTMLRSDLLHLVQDDHPFSSRSLSAVCPCTVAETWLQTRGETVWA